jgi:vacuolar-type H+-ATPase subunit F/Vma7
MPEERYCDKPFAIIGEEDLVLGFQALGFRVYPARDEGQTKAALTEVLLEKAAICLVQDNLYQGAKEEIDNYRNLPLPIFIPFAKDTGMSLLESMVKDLRLRAIGTF